MSPILGLHRHESQALRSEPNIGEPQYSNFSFIRGAAAIRWPEDQPTKSNDPKRLPERPERFI